MYSLVSKTLVVISLYLIVLILICRNNRSAVYVEGDEVVYLVLAFTFAVVFVLSSAIKIVGFLKREHPNKFFIRKRKFLVLGMTISVFLLLIPTIYNKYTLFNYGITASWRWSSGSDNFNVLLMHGIVFCEIDDNQRINFNDIDGDGYPDIVIGEDLNHVLLYKPNQKTFIGCSDLRG